MPTMALTHSRCRPVALLLLTLLCLVRPAHAGGSGGSQYIVGTGIDGVTRELAQNRLPSLYTGNFADCLQGGSLFNITNFDAAYYADNLTVLFHLDGTTNVQKEDLICRSAHSSPFPLSPWENNPHRFVCFVSDASCSTL